MEKEYMTLEQRVCVVCGKQFDTGSILLDQRFRKKFDRHTVTGWGMCADDLEMKTKGFTALVGIDEEKTDRQPGGNINPGDAYRTGSVAHLSGDVFKNIFSQDPPPGGLAFVPDAVIDMLAEMQRRQLEEAENGGE